MDDLQQSHKAAIDDLNNAHQKHASNLEFELKTAKVDLQVIQSEFKLSSSLLSKTQDQLIDTNSSVSKLTIQLADMTMTNKAREDYWLNKNETDIAKVTENLEEANREVLTLKAELESQKCDSKEMEKCWKIRVEYMHSQYRTMMR